MDHRADLKKLENFDAERGCFACGTDNPAGLHMEFYTDGVTVFSWLKVPPQLCGWRHITHGGIVSTILDEVMSWTAHHMIKKMILTRSIHVDFLKPLPVEQEIRAEGRVRQVNNEREAVLEAKIFNGNGTPCARASGSFALLTPRIARRLGVIEESIISNFERFIDRP
jgi:uncharacterized protein (TIGR00369 family)